MLLCVVTKMQLSVHSVISLGSVLTDGDFVLSCSGSFLIVAVNINPFWNEDVNVVLLHFHQQRATQVRVQFLVFHGVQLKADFFQKLSTCLISLCQPDFCNLCPTAVVVLVRWQLVLNKLVKLREIHVGSLVVFLVVQLYCLIKTSSCKLNVLLKGHIGAYVVHDNVILVHLST